MSAETRKEYFSSNASYEQYFHHRSFLLPKSNQYCTSGKSVAGSGDERRSIHRVVIRHDSHFFSPLRSNPAGALRISGGDARVASLRFHDSLTRRAKESPAAAHASPQCPSERSPGPMSPGFAPVSKRRWPLPARLHLTGEFSLPIAIRAKPCTRCNPSHFFTPASNAKLFTTMLALATLRPGLSLPHYSGIEWRAQRQRSPDRRSDSCRTRRPRSLESQIPLRSPRRLRGPNRQSSRRARRCGRRERAKGSRRQHRHRRFLLSLRSLSRRVDRGRSVFPLRRSGQRDFVQRQHHHRAYASGRRTRCTRNHAGRATICRRRLRLPIPHRCGGEKSDFAAVRQPGQSFLLLRGTIAVGHAPMFVHAAMLAPAETAAEELSQLLEARGVHVTGTAAAQHGAPPQTTASGDPILQSAGSLAPSAETVPQVHWFSPNTFPSHFWKSSASPTR